MKDQSATTLGANRTGMALSPIHGKQLIENIESVPPSSEGDERAIAEVRMDYMQSAPSIGSVPPPATLKGAAGAVVKALKAESMTVFVDKLGERLAFERTGGRLYEALISKFKATPEVEGGPTLEQLLKIQHDEVAHYELLKTTILELGGDPTAVTPSANVAFVTSLGLPQVLADPRTSLKQSLDAILVAELTDNVGWSLLIQVAEQLGYAELGKQFRQALRQEDEHLALVRGWVTKMTLREASAK